MLKAVGDDGCRVLVFLRLYGMQRKDEKYCKN
jgi:hypothetical protein